MGEGEGGMIWENVIETCIIYMKRVASQKKKKKESSAQLAGVALAGF